MNLCLWLFIGIVASTAAAADLGESAGSQSSGIVTLNRGGGDRAALTEDDHAPSSVLPLVQLNDESYFAETKREMQKKHRPNHWYEFFYPMLTPLMGGLMVFLSFPLMWFNERRASSSFCTPNSASTPAAAGGTDVEGGAATTPTTDGKAGYHPVAGAKNKAQEVKHHAEDEYEAKIEKFEHWLCKWKCCQGVEFACKKMPQGAHHDPLTLIGRVGGFMMLWIGLNMFFYPIYFILHMIWFVGAIIAGSLFFCIIKCACCGACFTVGTSYTIHRPAVLALVICSFIILVGFECWYIGLPKMHGGRYEFHPDK